MADMNIVIFSGRLTKDPEARTTTSGKIIAAFSVANNIGTREKPKTIYFECKAWEKTAEAISNHCQKGQQVTVRGRYDEETWDGTDGNKHRKTVIVVDQIIFGSKPSGRSSEGSEE